MKLQKIIREVIQENDKEKLIALLKNFDWDYTYSDDSRVYKDGEVKSKEIDDLVKKLGKVGEQLYKDAQPKPKVPDSGRYKKKNESKPLDDNTEEKRDSIMKDLKGNKRDFVKRYGKDAEKVMVGRATNIAKGKQLKEKVKETVKKVIK